jgi:hypothetical protein
VRKDDQRDASIDTFLHSSLRRGQVGRGSAGRCVEPETLAAWAEGSLSRAESAAVEAHVADCAACQQVLAVFARTSTAPAEPQSLWQRWRLGWAVPLAAAATAAAIWVAVPDDRKDPIQDAFTVADSPPSSQPDLTEPKTESADVKAPSAPLERSEARARRAADSSLRAQAEKPEVRQEKDDADRQGLARESANAAAPAAPQAAAARAETQTAATLSDAAAPAQQRAAAFAPAEVISPDPSVRWRVLPSGQLERSTNAGQSWEPATLSQKVTAVRAPSAAIAIAATADGREFRTDDQGKTWNLLQP